MLGSPNEGPPKAVNIQSPHRPPADLRRRQHRRRHARCSSTRTPATSPSLCLVVDHDDDEREYAYAGASVTNPDAESIVDTASRLSWTVVSMRDDWSRVFAG